MGAQRLCTEVWIKVTLFVKRLIYKFWNVISSNQTKRIEWLRCTRWIRMRDEHGTVFRGVRRVQFSDFIGEDG